MFLVTHVAVLERSGTTIFVHLLTFSVLIYSTVQSITYYSFAYVLINVDKISELSVCHYMCWDLDVAAGWSRA